MTQERETAQEGSLKTEEIKTIRIEKGLRVINIHPDDLRMFVHDIPQDQFDRIMDINTENYRYVQGNQWITLTLKVTFYNEVR